MKEQEKQSSSTNTGQSSGLFHAHVNHGSLHAVAVDRIATPSAWMPRAGWKSGLAALRPARRFHGSGGGAERSGGEGRARRNSPGAPEGADGPTESAACGAPPAHTPTTTPANPHPGDEVAAIYPAWERAPRWVKLSFRESFRTASAGSCRPRSSHLLAAGGRSGRRRDSPIATPRPPPESIQGSPCTTFPLILPTQLYGPPGVASCPTSAPEGGVGYAAPRPGAAQGFSFAPAARPQRPPSSLPSLQPKRGESRRCREAGPRLEGSRGAPRTCGDGVGEVMGKGAPRSPGDAPHLSSSRPLGSATTY